ncbi:MAG: hypothetical protein H7257_09515 [Taibaiella sp.]|nr:hypothetical protein [Taibaiella sp.]
MVYTLRLLLVTILFFGTQTAVAQSKHGGGHSKSSHSSDDDDDDEEADKPSKSDDDGPEPPEKDKMTLKDMVHYYSVQLPMNRNGSGTAWNPDKSPMYAYMFHTHHWTFMVHGDIFARFNMQDINKAGSRGGEKFDVPGMVMLSGQRATGYNGLFHFNIMLSPEAAVAGGGGYPLLYQTGETWQGKALIDRQHPHDLVSELSVSYAWAYADKGDVFIYAGLPGEPPLGPVTFMHRPSGSFNPDAPLSHHWVDATHIAFGVATLGVRYGRFKIEGSSFNGHEPDENRYNFDKPVLDSRSARLSFNPSTRWALQVSQGYLTGPEAIRPTENITRTTASASYVYPISPRKYFAATALWGQNAVTAQEPSNAALLEATLRQKKGVIYGRAEWVQKTGEELSLDPLAYSQRYRFNVQALTLGAAHDLYFFKGVFAALGAQATVSRSEPSLNGLYGKLPISVEVYLHFFPILQ